MKYATASRSIVAALAIFAAVLFYRIPVPAATPADTTAAATTAALKLLALNDDFKAGPDLHAVAVLVDYVLDIKPRKETPLPQIENANGAYHEYDTKIDFCNFLQYSFSSQIPSVITSPSSIRYSRWRAATGEGNKLPTQWKAVAPNGKPVVIRGRQRDGITPDQTTGVYYDYELKRTLILLNKDGRQVLISISKQADVSDVGKKGFILGNDDDWNYHYTDETGSAKAGLGWVKSYIYDYFSVAVYIESASSPATVRAGVFQWIRAGWSGVNFVQADHVISGMKRYARNSKLILESPRLPPPRQIAATYKRLSGLPAGELSEKYAALQQARLALAESSGQIKPAGKKADAALHASKEQMVEALMLEYLKITLGKPSIVGKQLIPGAS